MKLALLYLNKGGGIGQFSYMLAENLARKTNLTCYITDNPDLDYYKNLQCEVKVFNFKRGYKSLLYSVVNGGNCKEIVEEIISDSPDVIIDPGCLEWSPVIQRQLKKSFIPFIETVHDSTPHPGMRYIMYILYKHLYPSKADAILTLSDYCYNQAISIFPKKYHICSRHGIMLENENIDSRKIASNRNKMLFFGQITPYKGIDVLIKAYEIALKQNPEIKLDIVGKGHISEDLKDKIIDSGIGLKNEYVSDEIVKELFASHGVLLMPYSSATQSGVASVALANGLPSVATNVGALPEQIKNGINGIITPPENPEAFASAMLEIASDYEMALSMSEEAIKLAQTEYSWGEITDKLLDDIGNFLCNRMKK